MDFLALPLQGVAGHVHDRADPLRRRKLTDDVKAIFVLEHVGGGARPGLHRRPALRDDHRGGLVPLLLRLHPARGRDRRPDSGPLFPGRPRARRPRRRGDLQGVRPLHRDRRHLRGGRAVGRQDVPRHRAGACRASSASSSDAGRRRRSGRAHRPRPSDRHGRRGDGPRSRSRCFCTSASPSSAGTASPTAIAAMSLVADARDHLPVRRRLGVGDRDDLDDADLRDDADDADHLGGRPVGPGLVGPVGDALASC